MASNSKQIAKNTVVLYMRMVVIMLLALITSRVLLNVLGETDYGIYNVVGGFVSMFTILSGSLSTAISRFVTFGLGKNNKEYLKTVFCTSMNVQIAIAIIIIVLCELIGIWFLNNKMNIPADRIYAANCVLQFSIFSFAFSLLTVPYNALIIAHEKMSAYAYISIIDSASRLFVLYLINYIDVEGDNLILYSIVLFSISIFITCIYILYCYRNFSESKYYIIFDKSVFGEMFSFAGWSFLGNGAGILNTQGVSILINLFFGVKLNAARGIANQVNSMINQFTGSFVTSINPQITKNFAIGELTYMHSLILKSSKFSFFLFLFIAIPIYFEADTILRIWLGNIPDYTSAFVKWTILTSSTLVLGNALLTGISAIGNVKKYQIIVSLIGISELPITYFAFKIGADVIWAYILYFIVYFVLIFVRIHLVCPKIGMKVKMFYRDVLLRVLLVSLISCIAPLYLKMIIPESLCRLTILSIVSSFFTLMVIIFFGLTESERTIVISTIKEKMKI